MPARSIACLKSSIGCSVWTSSSSASFSSVTRPSRTISLLAGVLISSHGSQVGGRKARVFPSRERSIGGLLAGAEVWSGRHGRACGGACGGGWSAAAAATPSCMQGAWVGIARDVDGVCCPIAAGQPGPADSHVRNRMTSTHSERIDWIYDVRRDRPVRAWRRERRWTRDRFVHGVCVLAAERSRMAERSGSATFAARLLPAQDPRCPGRPPPYRGKDWLNCGGRGNSASDGAFPASRRVRLHVAPCRLRALSRPPRSLNPAPVPTALL